MPLTAEADGAQRTVDDYKRHRIQMDNKFPYGSDMRIKAYVCMMRNLLYDIMHAKMDAKKPLRDLAFEWINEWTITNQTNYNPFRNSALWNPPTSQVAQQPISNLDGNPFKGLNSNPFRNSALWNPPTVPQEPISQVRPNPPTVPSQVSKKPTSQVSKKHNPVTVPTSQVRPNPPTVPTSQPLLPGGKRSSFTNRLKKFGLSLVKPNPKPKPEEDTKVPQVNQNNPRGLV